MDAEVKRVLEAYNELGRESLEFSLLAGRGATRALVAQLVEQGWLRPAGEQDLFTRTEDGRLALAGPRDVTLYTRPGCHLCDEVKAQIAPLLGKFGARLREVNIDADPMLRERYTNDVPVIFLGSCKVAKHRVNLEQFRRQLEQSCP